MFDTCHKESYFDLSLHDQVHKDRQACFPTFQIEYPESRKSISQSIIISSHKKDTVQTEGRYYVIVKQNIKDLFEIAIPRADINLQTNLLELITQSYVSQYDMSKAIGVLWELMKDSNIELLDKALFKVSKANLRPEVFVTIARVLSMKRDELYNWDYFILRGCSDLHKHDPEQSKKILQELYMN